MGEIFLLTLVAAWLAGDYARDWLTARREARRLDQQTEMRRRLLAHAPDSPAAQETLGDALRAAGDLEEALAAYEAARALAQDFPESGGAGLVPGAGLEHKMRLTRLEIAEARSPGDYSRTLRTRQSVCRTCGALAMPQTRNCVECGAALPVDGFFDTLRDDAIRRSLVSETAQVVLILGTVAAALLLASWMPTMIRPVLAAAALIVVPLRLLRKIGDA